jgi:hypothetical protein
MYIHCKTGFLEVDRWDRSPIPLADHQKYIKRLVKNEGHPIFVVRSRQESTMKALFGPAAIFESPPDWDYRYRTYLSYMGLTLLFVRIADSLDYRNFKASCPTDQSQLAHKIWKDALL